MLLLNARLSRFRQQHDHFNVAKYIPAAMERAAKTLKTAGLRDPKTQSMHYGACVSGAWTLKAELSRSEIHEFAGVLTDAAAAMDFG